MFATAKNIYKRNDSILLWIAFDLCVVCWTSEAWKCLLCDLPKEPTELLHIKTDILRLQTMRYFKKFVFMFEKRDVKARQRLLALFVCGTYNRLKNLFAAVNATRRAIRILIRERGARIKKKLFEQKLSNLGLVLNKLIQLKRTTKC